MSPLPTLKERRGSQSTPAAARAQPRCSRGVWSAPVRKPQLCLVLCRRAKSAKRNPDGALQIPGKRALTGLFLQNIFLVAAGQTSSLRPFFLQGYCVVTTVQELRSVLGYQGE